MLTAAFVEAPQIHRKMTKGRRHARIPSVDPRDLVRLRDMRNHAAEAVGFASGRSRHDLDTDRMLELALVRLIEIIGEAAGHVSEATCQRLPTIPWPQIVGMRNRLVHGYDAVDRNILWLTIANELRPLIDEIDQFLGPPSP